MDRQARVTQTLVTSSRPDILKRMKCLYMILDEKGLKINQLNTQLKKRGANNRKTPKYSVRKETPKSRN